MALTEAEIKAAIVHGKELAHSREYEEATRGLNAPKWDDLTEEHRARVRKENRRYWDEMNDLGQQVRADLRQRP